MKTRTSSEWKELFAAWQASGKTKAEFCKNQNVSISMFYFWAKKLGFNLAASPQITISKPVALQAQQTFVEFDIPSSHVAHHHNPRIFRITTSYGAVLEIPL